MARTKSDRTTGQHPTAPSWQDPLRQQQPLVSGRWLLWAFLIVLGLAAVSAYLTLCLLFYQGQWQVVFHPSRTMTTTPSSLGMKYDEVHFDYSETGTPRLAGWWVPAEADGHYADSTLLFLHGASGSLSDCVQRLHLLHSLGINIFAFDYRGFGQSAEAHPSERRVYQDADAAWKYLSETRHIDPASIVVYGEGLGGTIAAETALRHPQASALVIEGPVPPALELIRADARTSILPVKLLFRDKFTLESKLDQLGFTPDSRLRQLIRGEKVQDALVAFEQRNPARTGPDLLVLAGGAVTADPHYPDALRRFLDKDNSR